MIGSTARRRAGIVTATVGALAAGAAAGLAIERLAVRRALGRDDPAAAEPFGSLRGAPYPVVADDGITLHVEIDEPDDQPDPPRATVVFCHGYALNQDSWHFQRLALRGSARLVFWDQRSHGRSERSPAGNATIAQTGRDLGRIIEEVAPEGPLVLVGHSMGGMSILALAEQAPTLFSDRVVGVGLLATSAAGLGDVLLGVRGLPGRVLRRAAPGVMTTLARRADLVDRTRRLRTDLSFALTRRYSFASDVPPSYVEWTAEMIAETPIDVVAEFFPDFDEHDRREALAAVGGVETLVMVGRDDRMTPLSHSEQIGAALPRAQLVVLDRCGHMLLLERHVEVSAQLVALLERSLRRSGERAARSRGGSAGR
jgi:pimeloyl-ACP methyl ester carboxylesterase